MKNWHSEKLITNDTQLDFNSNISVFEIVKMIQTATFNHSQEIHLGHDEMRINSNAFWVISKLKLKILGDIKSQDKVTLSTWTHPLSLVRALRDAEIKLKNKVLVRAVAEWCCLDFDTKKIRKLNSISYPELEMEKTKFNKLDFSKILDDQNLEFVYSKTIKASDIDVNFHTNNLKYITMAMDAFTLDELKGEQVVEFEIHFINQSYFGDEIKIYRNKHKKQFTIFGKLEDKTIFKAIVKFK